MSYLKGLDRTQSVLFPESIDQIISQDNVVRFIDVFIDSLDILAFGFRDVNQNVNGRPPYHPKDLLKLYIYAYLNKIRASRKLEIECKRNIELMWLIRGLAPDHNTISNFRRDNP
ncbi:MAG: transposase [Glaciecola sp.]|jgi:transposase